MNTAQFWVDHFGRPAPDVALRFVTLKAADCGAILEQRGLPRTDGEDRESAENRVFTFGEIVLKVFRPGRWSRAALEEEVIFLEDLRAAGVSAVRPIGGIETWNGLHHLAYERVASPYEEDKPVFTRAEVEQLIDLVVAFHDVGACRDAPARPRAEPRAEAQGLLEVIRRAGYLPASLLGRYREAVEALAERLETLLEGVSQQRIHADLGSWNVLWREDGPVMMDLDDFVVGPVALDLRLLSFPWRLDTLPEDLPRGERRDRQSDLVLSLYRERRPFPEAGEALMRPMGILRGVVFDAWFSANWSEPGFKAHYPDDNIEGEDYWTRGIQAVEGWLAKGG